MLETIFNENAPPFLKKLALYQQEFTQLRQHFHQNPELSREEYSTARKIESLLRSWGIKTERLIETGVVASITKGENPYKNIGLRADTDALPIEEETNLPYASQHQGVMHACGHDGHTVTLLMAAKYLKLEAEFNGTVTLIFQPDEEDTAGAKRMIEAGLFEKYPVDAVFGYHNFTGASSGTLFIQNGPQMAGTCSIKITVKSKGGHAAHPYQTVDTIFVAAKIITALQSIPSRNLSAIDSAVITIGAIHGGAANNAIPNQVTMEGTLRYFDIKVRERVKERIHTLTEGIAQSYGAWVEVSINDGYIPTINHPEGSLLVKDAMSTLFKENVIFEDKPPSMGAEDFGFMLAEKPGAYFFLGNNSKTPKGEIIPHHTSLFDFDDENLLIGSAIFIQLVKEYLR